MYTWHWNESFWNDISIQYLFHPVAHRYFDPVGALIEYYRYNKTLVKKKQELIRLKVFELQYSLENYYNLDNDIHEKPWLNNTKDINNNESINNKKAKWPKDEYGNPMRDAYDIIIDHVLGWHSGTEIDERKGTIPECWNNGIVNITLNKCVKKIK